MVKLLDAIFCDDIRYETNNKLSLMGLYNDRMIFHTGNVTEIKWPLPVRVSVLLRFIIEITDEHPDNFEFEYFVNDKSIIKLNGNYKIEANTLLTNLALTAEGIPLEPGNLGFSIKLLKGSNLLFSEERMHALKILND